MDRKCTVEAENIGLGNIKCSPTVPSSVIPPWVFVMLLVDLNMQQKLRKESEQRSAGNIVHHYIEQHFADKLMIFIDDLKDPETGHTGATVSIPQYDVAIKKRDTDSLSV